MGFDPDSIRRLARTFLETMPGRLDVMRQAVRSGDPARLAAAAHSMVGALTVFGAGDAIEAARAMEAAARGWKMPEAADALERLEAVSAPLVNSLTAYLA
jgi:HPt (histidine-containing phosphotransfer) domain-containing protein